MTGKPYAIKVISKTQIANLRMNDQLRNEIAIMQVVEHKNIVRMSTYFEDESNIYLIMELGGVRFLILEIPNFNIFSRIYTPF